MRVDLRGDTVELRCGAEDTHIVKNIVGGRFNKRLKCWEFPTSCLVDIKEAFKGRRAKVGPGVKELLESLETRDVILQGIKDNAMPLDNHPFLMEHQRKCKLIAKYFDRFALFLDTGTGKTITALEIIKDKGDRFLVLCPKAIIKAAWMEDAKEFFPEMKVMPISRNIKKDDYRELYKSWFGDYPPSRIKVEDLRKGLEDYAQAFIINPESFKADIKTIKDLSINGLVLDESTVIKNPNSQITKAVTSFADEMKYTYVLSGKPAPNGIMDYFSQMRVVDPGLLGESFYAFRMRNFLPTGYMGHDWTPKPGVEDEITKRIGKRAIFISKEECLDLPEKTYLIRKPEMPKEAMRYYKQMQQEQVVLLSNEAITAANKLAALMKLRQITSGFVIGSDSEERQLHGAKLQELLDTLDQIGDKQVIIWCQFQAEIRTIEDALTKQGHTVVTAYGGTKNVDQSIVDFKEGRAKYIIAHPATLKFGVTFTNCNYAVYYSISYNYEEYYQSHDRIYRKGQSKPCTFIFLLMEDTIDEVLYQVIQHKKDASYLIEEMIRRG